MSVEAPRGEELDYVIIRQYEPTDRTKLISLLKEHWPDYDPGVYSAVNYLIAENNGRIVGTVFCREVNKDIHLYDLVVCQRFRRQGVATALIKTAEMQAATIGMDKLRITASGPKLVVYYKNLGFEQTSPPKGKIMVKPIACHSPLI